MSPHFVFVMKCSHGDIMIMMGFVTKLQQISVLVNESDFVCVICVVSTQLPVSELTITVKSVVQIPRINRS